MLHIDKILEKAVELKASDIHISANVPPIARIHGKMIRLGEYVLTGEDTEALVKQLINTRALEVLEDKGESDFSYKIPTCRFRVNAFKQRDFYAASIRLISSTIPSMESLKLPPIIKELCKRRRGLILVTGPTGSGKSTTLAAMVDYMNRNYDHHIITIEDPIEYMHQNQGCLINQRELGSDTLSFAGALRAALRQDPDVILVGEMRDPETIATAVTAAETGHLVLSTLHTIGAAKTVDRIIDSFTPDQQQQVKTQLSTILEAVISQQIAPMSNGRGRVAAFEIMVANSAIRNLLREGKTYQMNTVIQTGSSEGMMTMDNCLVGLYKRGAIDLKTLLSYSVDENAVTELISRM